MLICAYCVCCDVNDVRDISAKSLNRICELISALLPPVVQVEKLARTLFLWKIEVHEQKEKVYEMRRWNEALVTNMLPEHVARHFLGSKKRDEVSSTSLL